MMPLELIAIVWPPTTTEVGAPFNANVLEPTTKLEGFAEMTTPFTVATLPSMGGVGTGMTIPPACTPLGRMLIGWPLTTIPVAAPTGKVLGPTTMLLGPTEIGTPFTVATLA
jgi:hypothetical protein